MHASRWHLLRPLWTSSDTIGESLATHLLVKLGVLGQSTHLKALSHTAHDVAICVARLFDHARLLELLGGFTVRQQRSRHAKARPNDNLVAHVPRFVLAHQGGQSAGDHVEKAGRGRQRLYRVGHLLLGVHAFEKQDVGTGGGGGLEAGDGLVEAERLQGVGACNEHNVVARAGAGGGGGADTGDKGVGVDKFFAQEVSTALGDGLVFNVQAGDAGGDVAFNLFFCCFVFFG